MSKKIRVICAICSRQKSEKSGLIPAHLRYTSPRIQVIKNIANKEGVPFFILSGKYGFISADKEVPYYDYLLTLDGVKKLVPIVIQQLNEFEIGQIDFYTKPIEGNRITYYKVIEEAAKATGVKLVLDHLP